MTPGEERLYSAAGSNKRRVSVRRRDLVELLRHQREAPLLGLLIAGVSAIAGVVLGHYA